MVKEKETKPRKNIKKEPVKSLKEKRAAKEAKKAEKSRMQQAALQVSFYSFKLYEDVHKEEVYCL